jgi:hypothetical protein
MKPADAEAYDWGGMITRLTPQFLNRPVYAIAAMVVRADGRR